MSDTENKVIVDIAKDAKQAKMSPSGLKTKAYTAWKEFAASLPKKPTVEQQQKLDGLHALSKAYQNAYNAWRKENVTVQKTKKSTKAAKEAAKPTALDLLKDRQDLPQADPERLAATLEKSIHVPNLTQQAQRLSDNEAMQLLRVLDSLRQLPPHVREYVVKLSK